MLAGFDLTIPAGIVARHRRLRTAPARPRSPSCFAGSTTRKKARSRSTASTCATLDLDGWRSRLTAVFQDFIRFELPLRDNVAPAGAAGRRDPAALAEAGAVGLADLDTVLARGYPGGTDLSGGQWQRIALARALCAVRHGAGVVLARRAHRPARRARRGRDLRSHPRRHAAYHHDPDLAPLLDGAPRRSHLRARARQGGRARHSRRADGGGRPLPDDVRACRRRGSATTARKERASMSSTDDLPPALPAMWRALKRGYQAEPLLLSVSFGLALLAALPDALHRAFAQAPGRRRARGPARAGAGRGGRAGRLGGRDLVPARDQRPHPAPVSRQADHRARVARRAAAGVGRPRSSTTSAPSISIASPCCATRSSCSTTCICRFSRRAAGSCGWG